MKRVTLRWVGLALGMALFLCAICLCISSVASYAASASSSEIVLRGAEEQSSMQAASVAGLQSGSASPDGRTAAEPERAEAVRVIIRLKGDPVASYRLRLRAAAERLSAAQDEQVRAYASTLRRQQEEFASALREQAVELQVRHYYGYVFNGLAGTIRRQDMERIAAMPMVQTIDLDHELHALLSESVPLIGANQVWMMLDPDGRTVTGRGIRVAVLDTGIDYTHPDLGGCLGPGCKVVGGYDVINSDADPFDDNGHGTHCAGIIAANGVLKGVAPDAILYAYKVLGSRGQGDDSGIIAGIELALNPDGDPATDDAVDVISMSLGGPGSPDDPFSQVVDSAVELGTVVVAAAGNSGPGYYTLLSPAVAPKAFTVGATDKNDAIAEFSSRGPVGGYWGLIKPDIVAPGVSIRSTVPAEGPFGDPSGYRNLSGTSMAAPHVAGCAALIGQLHPSWSPEMIKANLMNTARNLGLDVLTQGAGRVQVGEAGKAAAVIAPGSVSFGLVDARQEVWTRTVLLQLSNASTDSLSYSFIVSATLPAGASVVLSPTSATLGAGQTTTITAELTVDNALTPYAEHEPYMYEGRIIAQPLGPGLAADQTAAGPLAVPFTFAKVTGLEITFDWDPYEVLVHDGVHAWRKLLPGTRFGWVLPRGTYDVIANSEWGERWVVREGVLVTEVTSLDLQMSEAIHQVSMAPQDRHGQAIDVPKCAWSLCLRHRASGIGLEFTAPYHARLTQPILSNVSTDYAWEVRMDTPWEGDWYELNYQLIGISASSTQQNDPVSFRQLAYHFTAPGVTSMLVWLTASSRPDLQGNGYYFSQTLPPTAVQNLYYMPFPDDFHLAYTVVNTREEGTRRVLATSPYLRFRADGQIDAYPGAWQPVLEVTGDELHLGQPPTCWFSAFHNTETELIVQPAGANAGWFSYQGGDRSAASGLPYEVYQSGTAVLGGTLDNVYIWWHFMDPVTRTLPSRGVYTFTVSSEPYSIAGRIGQARLVAEFDTTLVDKDPPTLLSLNVLLDGETTFLVPPNYAATVRFRVQDYSGIAMAALFYRAGGDWIALPTTATGEYYFAALPGLAGGETVSLRLFVRDTAGNSLNYEVEPALQVALPAPLPMSPNDGWITTNPEVTFGWDSVLSATAYRIEIDTTPAFTSTHLVSATVTTTDYAATLDLGTWFWRVVAIGVSGDESDYSTLRRLIIAQPVLQLTTDAAADFRPSLIQTRAGRLWVVWAAGRSGASLDIWYRTSDNGGTTWSQDAQLTTHPNGDYHPEIFQAADGRLWVVWTSARLGEDIWYKTSDDNGATWSADTRLTTAPGSDECPTIVQTLDGKLWVVWVSDRTGNTDLWYKTTSDGGGTWSSDVQLTVHPGWDWGPAIAQTLNGELWVAWSTNRLGNSMIFYKTSADGGGSWSAERLLTTGFSHEYNPSLIRDDNGALWLMWNSGLSGNEDLWLKFSDDGGANWSSEAQWTRYVGEDSEPDLAALRDGAIALVWTSDRSSNRDIWFGILGRREDVEVAYRLPGDMDGNCRVDIVDIMLVASRWNTELGDPQYDPRYDLNSDGAIDVVDIMQVASHWSETCSGAG